MICVIKIQMNKYGLFKLFDTSSGNALIYKHERGSGILNDISESQKESLKKEKILIKMYRETYGWRSILNLNINNLAHIISLNEGPNYFSKRDNSE